MAAVVLAVLLAGARAIVVEPPATEAHLGIEETPWAPLLDMTSGKLLGEGGFGTATQYDLKPPCDKGEVVVKAIKAEDKMTKIFQENEVETLRSLRGSPNVLQMFDSKFVSGRLLIMSEVARGGEAHRASSPLVLQLFPPPAPLGWMDWAVWKAQRFYHQRFDTQERKEKRPQSRTKFVLMLARDALQGLVGLHSKGWIHHDLKPANIWLTYSGDAYDASSCLETMTCRAIIGDFGLASKPNKFMKAAEVANLLKGVVSMAEDVAKTIEKKKGGQVQWSDEFSGTPRYKAPEHARGAAVFFESDVFSLGLLLADLVVRSSAFLHTSTFPTRRLKMLEGKKGLYPAGLTDLLAQMIQKEWWERPSAQDALKRVQTIIAVSYPGTPDAPAVPAAPNCVADLLKQDAKQESGQA